MRATHSSGMYPSTFVEGVNAAWAGAGTNKKEVDNVCLCTGDKGLVDCRGVKDGGGSRELSSTASVAGADERFCYRSRRAQVE